MFGFSKKRFAALRAQVERGSKLVANEGETAERAFRAMADSLSAAIDAVHNNDINEVYAADENEQLYNDAKRLHDALLERVKRAQRAQKRLDDQRASAALLKRFRLKRCPLCSGSAFFVREKLQFETYGPLLDVALIVCAGCGDARMSMVDDLSIDRLQDDRNYVYVELPEGGPFRG